MLNNTGIIGLLPFVMLVLLLLYFFAASKVTSLGHLWLRHPEHGRVCFAPIGFSWTTYFFGFFPAMVRGHWQAASAMLLLFPLTLGLSQLYFAYFYNRAYLKHRLSEGYVVSRIVGNPEAMEPYLGFEFPVSCEQ